MAIFEITLLFLGSVIGAGFATGAEIITFFGDFRLPVWCIASIVGLTMFLIITLEILMYYPKYNQRERHMGPIDSAGHHTHQQFLVKFLDVVFVMIYLILFTAMTAGIKQITNIGICIMSLIVCSIIALFGIQRLSRLNIYIVLMIIVLITSIALSHLTYISPPEPHQQHNYFSAIFWALLYAGLNCFMFPELITAFAQNHQRRTLLWAGVITALLITFLVALILLTIKATNTESAPIPLLAAAPNAITISTILLAVLTSQYTALFATIQRLQKIIPSTKNKPQLTAVCICICALIGSFCGFNHIIEFGYPLIGAFTCFYLLFSFLSRLYHQSPHHPN